MEVKNLGERARILVVEDDESIRKTLTAILEDKGYNVETAKNGKEAIRKSKGKFFNLALIDIRLPDIEGVELLTAIQDTTPKMVKIIMTGYPSLQNAITAVNKGADGYLLKPFNIGMLLRTIKEHLKKQQQAKKYSQQKVTEFIQARVKEIEEEIAPRRKTR
jgi:DNA-binding NtrC family response regulator